MNLAFLAEFVTIYLNLAFLAESGTIYLNLAFLAESGRTTCIFSGILLESRALKTLIVKYSSIVSKVKISLFWIEI